MTQSKSTKRGTKLSKQKPQKIFQDLHLTLEWYNAKTIDT